MVTRRISRNAILAAALAASLVAANISNWRAAAAAGSAYVASPGAGQTGPRSAVPWQRVGAGWVLAEYWPGKYGGIAKPAELYLFDPAGGRYQLYRWPATKNPPFLVDWSGDKTRALVDRGAALEQVILATGKVTHLRLPAKEQVVGYTRPSGHGLLGWRLVGHFVQFSRYRLNGRLAKVLTTGYSSTTAVSSATGSTLAIGVGGGVELVSKDGGRLRKLTVPHAVNGCLPSRWWNAGTILASCQAGGDVPRRLWLVPADGSTATALTPQRSSRRPDPGDIDAWHLSGNLYLQALGSYGRAHIFRRAGNKLVKEVDVPGTTDSNWILTTSGSRILVAAVAPCSGRASLLWLNPTTRHEQVLLKAPPGKVGLQGAVPYGQPTGDIEVAVACAVEVSGNVSRQGP